MAEQEVVGLHLGVHGLNKKGGIAAVIPAFTADGALVARAAEEFTAVEAGAVGEGTNHGIIGASRSGVEGRLARHRRGAGTRAGHGGHRVRALRTRGALRPAKVEDEEGNADGDGGANPGSPVRGRRLWHESRSQHREYTGRHWR